MTRYCCINFIIFQICPIQDSFCVFVLFTWQFKITLKKSRCCARDLNLRPRDRSCTRNHWAMAGTPLGDIKFKFPRPWWWPSGQRACHLLRRSEFESRWSLQLFTVKFVLENKENLVLLKKPRLPRYHFFLGNTKPLLSGFICAYNFEVLGLNPKHTIYASSIYSQILY